MPAAPGSTGFLPTVEAEIAAVQAFLDLLERERQALVKGETDDLPALAKEKNTLAGQLTALGAQRNERLSAAGVAADLQSIDAWFQAHPEENQAQAAWARLLSLAAEARENNAANGEMIHIRLQHNAQAIQALLGTHGSLTLYGPDGQSSAPNRRRISDSA